MTTFQNKVVTFTIPGGLIGLFVGDEARKLTKVLEEANQNGWRYRTHSGTSRNIIGIFVQLFFLIITLTLWTPGEKYILVLDPSED